MVLTPKTLLQNIDLQKNIGGKAQNLLRLQAAGCLVPDWSVIPSDSLTALIPEHLKTPQKIVDFIQSTNTQFNLKHQFNHLKTENLFAVRSSALVEDGSEHSFAGLFESYLYVKAEDIETYVKKVWASAYSERVIAYRKERKVTGNFGIAVIIQEMVNSEVSGVAFGANPATGNRKEKVINAVYGLGEGLVSGALNADTFLWEKENYTQQIAKKEQKFHLSLTQQGTECIAVATDLQEKPTLNKTQLKEISDVLDRLFLAFGRPQDIEFTYDKTGILTLLQTRPITNLSALADKGGQYIVWDNSNIIESYPGVTTPLTFSFILKIYEAVYTHFGQIMGIKKTVIEENHQVFSNMLGLMRGRVYYNLLSWYKALAMFPAYSLNAGFMETMMGVKERFELPNNQPISKWKARISVFGTIVTMLFNLIQLPRLRRIFLEDLNETIVAYKAINFDLERPEDLKQHYFNLENILVKKWKTPLINDFFAMIYFGILQKMAGKLETGNPNLHNDLLAGSNDIISTEPVRRILEISTAIVNDEKATATFKEDSAEKIWFDLQHSTTYTTTIKNLIDSYLERFGNRCVGELKLETISYVQNPVLFIEIIQSYVRQGITQSVTNASTAKDIRKQAMNSALAKQKGRFLKRFLFKFVVRKTRSIVSARENLRFERTRVFGLVRHIFTAIGKRFESEGIIERERDIFYLTKEEIFAYIGGTAISLKIKETIALRKAEYAAYEREQPTAERLTTHGIVYHANDFYRSPTKNITTTDNGKTLKGIGCSQGVIKGKVRIVKSPNEIRSLDGDILVTSSTDPGWVTLFPSASAILVERGSLLSHSAIVSRELGIPCIVGINGLLETLTTGDIVEMDGSTGIVVIKKEMT